VGVDRGLAVAAFFNGAFFAEDGFVVGLVDFFLVFAGVGLFGADFGRALLVLGAGFRFADVAAFFDFRLGAARDAAFFGFPFVFLFFAMFATSAPRSLADDYVHDNPEPERPVDVGRVCSVGALRLQGRGDRWNVAR
jgi:hypothetical protein